MSSTAVTGCGGAGATTTSLARRCQHHSLCAARRNTQTQCEKSVVACRSSLQQQTATSCLLQHKPLHSRQLITPRQQHPKQQQHRRTTAAKSASAAGSAAQPDASSDGSWFTKVVLPTALVLLVCNMDRICLSVAILPMAQEYGWPASVQVGSTTAAAAVLSMALSGSAAGLGSSGAWKASSPAVESCVTVFLYHCVATIRHCFHS
jgi:hypothetical protein